jgi:polysaccharide export outer membrane protein
LGNAGGKTEVVGKVIPLQNENMSVIEIITLAGGMDNMAKAHKIRLIRGDLRNPSVYLIDLSTMEGVRKSQLNVQPNDIIYVERQRRVVSQFLTELAPLITVVNTILLIYLTTRRF